jgi:hypothetical protein
MDKRYTVIIADNKSSEITSFPTNNFLGAVTASEFENDRSDTTQIVRLEEASEKEVTKLMAGCINSFFMTIDDVERSLMLLDASVKAAYAKYMYFKENGID